MLNPDWDKLFSTHEWGKYPAEELIKFSKSLPKKSCILEVGCGTGANIWYLAREGFKAYGIDGSQVAITKAQDRLKKDKLSANLQLGDITNIPYSNNYFDGVIDNESLYSNSLKDTKLILGEIKRVLKKKGLFYSRTFNKGTSGLKQGRILARFITKKGIYGLYGRFFKILSLDKIEYTNNNGAIKISEWIIVCQKD